MKSWTPKRECNHVFRKEWAFPAPHVAPVIDLPQITANQSYVTIFYDIGHPEIRLVLPTQFFKQWTMPHEQLKNKFTCFDYWYISERGELFFILLWSWSRGVIHNKKNKLFGGHYIKLQSIKVLGQEHLINTGVTCTITMKNLFFIWAIVWTTIYLYIWAHLASSYLPRYYLTHINIHVKYDSNPIGMYFLIFWGSYGPYNVYV